MRIFIHPVKTGVFTLSRNDDVPTDELIAFSAFLLQFKWDFKLKHFTVYAKNQLGLRQYPPTTYTCVYSNFQR